MCGEKLLSDELKRDVKGSVKVQFQNNSQADVMSRRVGIIRNRPSRIDFRVGKVVDGINPNP